MTLDEAFDQLRRADRDAHRRLPLPSSDLVDMIERELGVPFHSDYRRFLLEVSNVSVGILEPALVSAGVSEYRYLRSLAIRGWRAGIPRSELPFCQHNGNFYTINSIGRVSFWDHDDESMRDVGDLAMWIEDWLADE